MSAAFIKPLLLPPWAQQLAGIFPLTALIEFIDLPTKLHLFELAGCVPLWNWPVTPAGARLLLSTLDNSDACCLDREERSNVLHCVDGRYGDCYPSSTPTTTRLVVGSRDAATARGSASSRAIQVPNLSPLMSNGGVARPQTLTVVLLEQEDNDSMDDMCRTRKGVLPFSQRLRRSNSWVRLRSRSIAYRALSVTGWVALCGTLAVSLICGLYIAVAYLVLLPLTGLVIHATHSGGHRRQLSDKAPSEFQRMVVCTSSWNGTHWWAFVGGSRTVNSLLNKPLLRVGAAPVPRLWPLLLQVLIAGQWAVALASCALMDWNAVVVSFWFAFCAVSSGYLVRPRDCVRDWLRNDCRVKTTFIEANLSSRRSLLSALVYLNPDTKERRTSWIDPILAHCEERNEWETTLLECIEKGTRTLVLTTICQVFSAPDL